MYYRLYNNNGAMPSKHPAQSNDLSVGRIKVISVPPPHTAASIMKCISNTERFKNTMQRQLFVNIYSEFPIGEGHVSILAGDRPGSTPANPMAIVELQDSTSAPTHCPTFTKQIRTTSTLGESTFKSLRIYYAQLLHS